MLSKTEFIIFQHSKTQKCSKTFNENLPMNLKIIARP